jgi:hypothetical protein
LRRGFSASDHLRLLLERRKYATTAKTTNTITAITTPLTSCLTSFVLSFRQLSVMATVAHYYSL